MYLTVGNFDYKLPTYGKIVWKQKAQKRGSYSLNNVTKFIESLKIAPAQTHLCHCEISCNLAEALERYCKLKKVFFVKNKTWLFNDQHLIFLNLALFLNFVAFLSCMLLQICIMVLRILFAWITVLYVFFLILILTLR